MDFKKIKPNDFLGYLDDLVSKIPESISSLLTKVMVGILIFAMLYAVYYGYQQGYGSATQEGQELAKDTKSLFLEDMEREYNRKRKNIRMPSSDSLIDEDSYKTPKQYEAYGRANESGSIVNQSDSILENDKGIRTFRRSGDTSPLAELETSQPDPSQIPSGSNNDREVPRRRLQLKDTFDTPVNNYETQGLNSILDRVHSDPNYESKILDRTKSEKRKKDSYEKTDGVEMDSPKKDTGNLPLPEKSQKKEKKRELIPLDGNE